MEKSLKNTTKIIASTNSNSIAVNAPPTLTLDELYSKQSVDRLLSASDASSTYFKGDVEEEEGQRCDQEEISQDGIVCPYPTSVVWWQTKRKQDRAIVGYSDGSVCFLCK